MKVNRTRSILLASLITSVCLAGIFVARRTWKDTRATTGPVISAKAFDSPEEAAQALIVAVDARDTTALMQIFGSIGEPIIHSGDPVQDRNNRAIFVRKAKESLKLEPDPMDSSLRYMLIGTDNHPFSVPIVHKNGSWRFDTERGLTELLARRIGFNELDAIEISEGYVESQYEYAEVDRDGNGLNEYAQKLISSPGKRDGLYWPSENGSEPSPISSTIVKASMEGYSPGDRPSPYHGYYFRILKAQGPNAPGGERDYVHRGLMIGGFGLVAWPAQYGTSGIRTFIVNHAGLVYEKDLGGDTATLASKMGTFDPDQTWRPVR